MPRDASLSDSGCNSMKSYCILVMDLTVETWLLRLDAVEEIMQPFQSDSLQATKNLTNFRSFLFTVKI